MPRRVFLLLFLTYIFAASIVVADSATAVGNQGFPAKNPGNNHGLFYKITKQPAQLTSHVLYAAHLFHLAAQLELTDLNTELQRLPQTNLWRLLALYRAELVRADQLMASFPDGDYPVERWKGQIMPRPNRSARQVVRSIMTMIESKLQNLQADRIVTGQYIRLLGGSSQFWIELRDLEHNTLICYDMVSTIAPPGYRFNQADLLRFWLKRDDFFVDTWALIKFEVLEPGHFRPRPGPNFLPPRELP